jgi:deazaflavin-dependent oxidoreductase (nitroreductase family)
MAEEITESALPFAREHIAQYVASNGEDGHIWNGVPTLLITTTGAKTGRRIRQALIYGRSATDGYVVVASKGGAPQHPGWYFNMTANPSVTVQVGAEVFEATPRVAEGEERAALWTQMAGVWKDYDDYATKTDRVIPVVVLDRAVS